MHEAIWHKLGDNATCRITDTHLIVTSDGSAALTPGQAIELAKYIILHMLLLKEMQSPKDEEAQG